MKDNAQNQDSTGRIRRQYSGAEKVRLLRLHLVEGQAISAICDTHQIHPTLFYQWQKTFFENGAAAFDRSPRSRGHPDHVREQLLTGPVNLPPFVEAGGPVAAHGRGAGHA